jgi:tRNA (cytidine/uridine-2'-O-)-methyltransferase
MQIGTLAKVAAAWFANFSRPAAFIMRLALFQPDIPQNTGNMMRLAACLGIGLDIIEPCGFVLDDRRLRRAGMDYCRDLDLRRHESWATFEKWRLGEAPPRRLIALTRSGERAYVDFAFVSGDILLVGRESAGLPDTVHDAADMRLAIPMAAGLRSLNVATAAAMVLGEAMRQTNWRKERAL